MVDSKFTRSLTLMGWHFITYGPDANHWVQLNDDGEVTAHQGDIVWQKDLARIGFPQKEEVG